MDPRIRAWLVGVVSVGWLVNLAAPLFVPTYQPNLIANAPLMLILGALFTTRGRGGDDKK